MFLFKKNIKHQNSGILELSKCFYFIEFQSIQETCSRSHSEFKDSKVDLFFLLLSTASLLLLS